MIDKTIGFIILIVAAIINLPLLLNFIVAMLQIQKEYNEKKEEDKDVLQRTPKP
jgi:hypothetical protein